MTSLAKRAATFPANVRQATRRDGSRRLWWEPSRAARALGYRAQDLDPDRLTWSEREAARLNDLVQRKIPAETTPTNARRDLTALATTYLGSLWFADLAEATQADYRRTIAAITAETGSIDVAACTHQDCARLYREWRDRRGDAQARSMARKLSVLFTYAGQINWRAGNDNPASKLRVKALPPRNRVATWPELSALLEACRRHAPQVGAAICLSFFGGQRQTDILAAKVADINDGVWTVTQQKRGKTAIVPIHPAAQPWIDMALVLAGRGGSHHVITSAIGRGYTDARRFRDDWQFIRSVAAEDVPTIEDLQFRDLRRSASHYARHGGASSRDRGDLLANTIDTNPLLDVTYAPVSAEGARRAVAAIQPPADWQTVNPSEGA